MENIQVAVRLRPLTSNEIEHKELIAWEVDQKTSTINQMIPTNNKTLLNFPFDHIYGQNSSNLDIYNNSIKSIVESSINGINGTIFTYGQTSSGKTYTMRGNDNDVGILSLSLQSIFKYICDNINNEFLLRVSYMEVYNENVYDLLTGNNVNLSVHEDKEKGFYIDGLKEIVVTSVDQMFELMTQGELNRHFGHTNMNEESSRSHVIFRIMIENLKIQPSNEISGKEKVKVSTLNFVDLGGSERLTQTGAVGERMKEGKSINKSLLFLGIVISKLAEGDSYIPFRDSKLTRILSGSLGGNSRTAIICCVSPALFNTEHTINTLRFGTRALRVKQSAVVNEVDSQKALIHKHHSQSQKLKNRLSMFMSSSDQKENYDNDERLATIHEIQNSLEEQNNLKIQLEGKLNQLTKIILLSNSAPTESSQKLTRSLSLPTLETTESSSEYYGTETQDCLDMLSRNGKNREIAPKQDNYYRMQQLISRNNRITKENEDKDAQLQQYESKFNHLNLEVNSLNQSIFNLESTISKKDQQLDSLSNENTKLKMTVADFNCMVYGDNINSCSESKLREMDEVLTVAHKQVLKYISWSEFKNSSMVQNANESELSNLPLNQQVEILKTKNTLLQQNMDQMQFTLVDSKNIQKMSEENFFKKSQELDMSKDEMENWMNNLKSELESERAKTLAQNDLINSSNFEIKLLKGKLEKQENEMKQLKSQSQEASLKLIKHFGNSSISSMTNTATAYSDENSSPSHNLSDNPKETIDIEVVEVEKIDKSILSPISPNITAEKKSLIPPKSAKKPTLLNRTMPSLGANTKEKVNIEKELSSSLKTPTSNSSLKTPISNKNGIMESLLVIDKMKTEAPSNIETVAKESVKAEADSLQNLFSSMTMLK